VPSIEALLSHACLNCAASANSSSSSGKHFNYFCCWETDPHWTELPSISSWFFTLGFSISTESLDHDAGSTYVPICAKIVLKYFITYCDWGFPLLPTFHPPAVKSVSVYTKIWSLQNEVIQAQENQMI
jgi:hypothetical protein